MPQVDAAERARSARVHRRLHPSHVVSQPAIPEGPEGHVTVTAYAWMAPAGDGSTMETG